MGICVLKYGCAIFIRTNELTSSDGELKDESLQACAPVVLNDVKAHEQAWLE
jgi:hypothetical protein